MLTFLQWIINEIEINVFRNFIGFGFVIFLLYYFGFVSHDGILCFKRKKWKTPIDKHKNCMKIIGMLICGAT